MTYVVDGKKLEKKMIKRSTEKRGKKREKRGIMTIKTFDFVAKEVVYTNEKYQSHPLLLKFSK